MVVRHPGDERLRLGNIHFAGHAGRIEIAGSDLRLLQHGLPIRHGGPYIRERARESGPDELQSRRIDLSIHFKQLPGFPLRGAGAAAGSHRPVRSRCTSNRGCNDQMHADAHTTEGKQQRFHQERRVRSDHCDQGMRAAR